jgi:NTE family protein
MTHIRTVNLALQGGGSHGAFTWGVLDALLEDGRVRPEGVSGTSAGAMNAVVLADGLASAADKPWPDAAAAARDALRRFWDGVAALNPLNPTQRNPWAAWFGLSGQQAPTDLTQVWLQTWQKTISPYQSNPLGLNPLRDLLDRQVDFDRLAATSRQMGKSATPPLKVFVTATCVRTGKAEVFTGSKLSAAAVMASACLPLLFQAVEIDGEAYWDGGYCGNPALHPLIYQCDSRDIVLVQINPIAREQVPTDAQGILDRVNEITFNAALLAEMRAIDFVKRLLAQGKLDPSRYKDVLVHRIDGGDALEKMGARSKLATDAPLLHQLFELGRHAANAWLSRHLEALGQVGTVNIARDYLDDLRVPKP